MESQVFEVVNQIKVGLDQVVSFSLADLGWKYLVAGYLEVTKAYIVIS